MIKSLFFILMLLSFAAPSLARDAQYYLSHPKSLQAVLLECPQKQPHDLSCDQLQPIAQEINGLVYELRGDPQGYGQKILALQMSLASLQTKNTDSSELDETRQQLLTRLAVVKWLESPQG